jgi:hypothetical protein
MKFIIPCVFILFLFHNLAVANPDLREIQRQFNSETISRPFSVPDQSSLTNSLKEATQRGTPTKTQGFTPPACVGVGCAVGGHNYAYGSYFGGYARPYYGGLYGLFGYRPYYYGW